MERVAPGDHVNTIGVLDPQSPFVLAYVSDDHSVMLMHRDGVPWHETPLPAPWHSCQAQTIGWTGYFTQAFRCACGAIKDNRYRAWSEKNSSRRSKSRRRRWFRR